MIIVFRSNNQSAQIARVPLQDRAEVERVRHEVLVTTISWVAEYGLYQSGGWWTTSLVNHSGDATDVVIKDCDPRATDLLLRMPRTRQLLDRLGLSMMWVRLARLASNAFLWEHRDYGELSSAEKHRLHIPLCTNESAYLVIGGARIHLTAGSVWRLTPTYAHGVCNLYGPDRIHIVIDCYADAAFERLTSKAHLLQSDAMQLPEVSPEELETHLGTARRLLSLGYRTAAESHLLRLYYRYALPSGGAYDLIIETYDALGLAEDAATWRAKKAILLGEEHT